MSNGRIPLAHVLGGKEIGYDDIVASERALIVAYIRTVMLEYAAQVAALKRHVQGPKSPAWTEYAAAVSKASMARVLALSIERGDHRKPVAGVGAEGGS